MTITAMLVTTLTIHMLAAFGLWLGLRFCAEQQRGHRRYVVALAHTLRAGSPADDRHGDGCSTQLTIGLAGGDS